MAGTFRMLIDGGWVESESGAAFEATSPSSGESVGRVPEGTRVDARRAIDAASAAAPGWARRSAFDPAAAMRRVAEVEELIAYFEMAAADAVRADGSLRRRSMRTSASCSSACRSAWSV